MELTKIKGIGEAKALELIACIELGRTRPWYGAIITVILSIFLAVLPTAVNQFNQSGAQILNPPTFNFDTGLICFQEDLEKNNCDMVVSKESKKLTATNWQAMTGTTMESRPWKHNQDLQVYYFPSITDTDFNNYYTNLTKAFNPLTGEPLDEGYVSFILFSSTRFAAVKFSKATTSGSNAAPQSASLFGFFDALPNESFNFRDLNRKDFRGNPHAVKTESTLNQYINDSLNAWGDLFTTFNAPYKNGNAWKFTLITSGGFAAFTLFMGLLLFLMTRGKNNPYRIYTIWECQKIAYWESFTPGLLSLAFGFLIPTMSIMWFVLTLGIRTMWLSMKSVRPQ